MVKDARRRQLLTLGALMPAWPALALPATLRFAVSESWAPPYLMLQAGVPAGGLLFALMWAIADEVGARPAFVRLPSKRVDAALAAGDVDMHCLISPSWSDGRPPGRFGPPMVVLEDVLVTREAGEPVDLAAQRGLRLGTVLGYRYEGLLASFASGAVKRDDAPSQQRMLEKLRLGRTDAAVCDRRVLDHFNRDLPPAERLHVRQSLSETVTHACLSPRAAWPEAHLLAALERVVSRGTLRRLLGGER